MSKGQIVTVNVHHPRVKHVTRHPDNVDGTAGIMAITLGNSEMHGEIAILTTDELWSSVVRAVARFQATEAAANKISGAQYCQDCSFIAVDADDMTEHMFGDHPARVAQ